MPDANTLPTNATVRVQRFNPDNEKKPHIQEFKVPLTSDTTILDALHTIKAEKGLHDHALRVFVSGGGCSGLSYGITFAQGEEFGDQVFEVNGVKVNCRYGQHPVC